ncbi:hypothetical protein ILUMI_02561 [Ignelater luminosus]|uniref:Uncharacterized protein n=1 Tax=Ignelater luminosus TaxID=2038154 RepID=A0A8K0GKR2_IGNLU|nr:hypothetical protein ILUMI_02561 [Ignelater luminosus]
MKRKRESSSDSSISIILECESRGEEDFDILTIGEYVLLFLNFISICKIIDRNVCEYSVTVMAKSGLLQWKWPENEDIMWYPKEDIVQKIEEPGLKNNSELYVIPEMKKFTATLLSALEKSLFLPSITDQ